MRILRKVLTVEIYSHTVKKEKNLDLLERGAARNRLVIMTFLLFAPASTQWLGWRKTQKLPRGPLTIGRFCDINYFDTLLRYVLSVTFRGTVVMKVMDKKTLVKRRWRYEVRITVYILTPSEFCQTRVHKSLIGNLARHSFSLFDRNKTRPQTSKTSEWLTASLSLAERWTITGIRRSAKSVLTFSLLTDVLPL